MVLWEESTVDMQPSICSISNLESYVSKVPKEEYIPVLMENQIVLRKD